MSHAGHRPPPAKTFFFAAIAFVLGMGVLEIAARLALAPSVNSRWKYRSALVRAEGFPDMDRLLAPDPDLFWRVAPQLESLHLVGHFHDGVRLDFVVSTDEHGFRAMTPVPNPRVRVLFVGDSTTFGLGVDDAETFVSLVQAELPDVACTNAGVPGYTAYQGRKWIDRLRSGPAPDLTFVSFGLNDAESWDDLTDPAHDAMYARVRRWEASGLVRLLRQILGRRAEPSRDWSHEGRPRLTDEDFERELDEILGRCRSWGTQPVLVLWPYAGQMAGQPLTSKQKSIRRVARAQGVPLLDLLRLFRSAGGRALYCDVVHANEAGNVVAAQAVEAAIRTLLGMPAPPGATPAVTAP